MSILLRDMIESDIEDYVRWFTTDVEWMNWDAPWESHDNEWNLQLDDPERVRREWNGYYDRLKSRPADRLRTRLEIEKDGKHIGWVCAYYDIGYAGNPGKEPAIGIDIPEPENRGGIGTKALELYIDYLKMNGYRRVYTQTWSGNVRMVHIAEKLGFVEMIREKNLRRVNGRYFDALTFVLELY